MTGARLPSARIFVTLFLAAFVACGLFTIEAWPLTGWHLFSHARTDAQTGWLATAVAPDGSERAIPFAELGAAYSGWVQILSGFERLPDRERAAVCGAWMDAVRAPVKEVRIYRTAWLLSSRVGARAAPATRWLRWRCSGRFVSEVKA